MCNHKGFQVPSSVNRFDHVQRFDVGSTTQSFQLNDKAWRVIDLIGELCKLPGHNQYTLANAVKAAFCSLSVNTSSCSASTRSTC